MKRFLLLTTILSLSCELYQSPARQCFQNPDRTGCEGLSINFLQNVGQNARKHCLFNRREVASIRQDGNFQEVEGLKSWKNTDFLNVEVESGDQVFNCVFEPGNLPEDIYVSLTYELVAWLIREP